MTVQDWLSRNLRTLAMPVAMVVGALLCRQTIELDGWTGGRITPTLIWLMLFVTFCRVRLTDMRFTPLHIWLIIFQFGVSALLYLLLRGYDPIVAQGAMICVLAPVAMASVVIGGMLGANVASMATFSLLCNLCTALLAPLMLSWAGTGECTVWQLMSRVAPLLIAPFLAAQLCRLLLRRVAAWIAAHGQLSFYCWLISLVVIIGRTTGFIIDHHHDAGPWTELLLALAALVVCLLQFKVGRTLGARYGDTAAGGQSLGQKNTVLAVWLSLTFLNPISSIAPTAYIVWQNLVNSYQLYRYGKK